MKLFEIKDCALLRRMSGLLPASNLRELRDRVSLCRPEVLQHHFYQTLLVPSFDYPDFRSDFAVWIKRTLDEDVLAERLGILDPYSFTSIEDLRRAFVEMIDERLSEIPYSPSAAPGHEFYFMEAPLIIFDTGKRIKHPSKLAQAIGRMTLGSIYFHFLEARRRTPGGLDDFSAWLGEWGPEWDPGVRAVRSIDYIFYSLQELKKELILVLQKEGS